MKSLISLALLAFFYSVATANTDLIINKLLIKPAGGAPGYECFEIRNVSDRAVELADEHIALIGINNLHPSKGKIDFWYEFTERLPSGEMLCVRSRPPGGKELDIEAPFAEVNGSWLSREFFPGHAMNLPDNGDNFILVKGFHKDAINPRTKARYAFGNTLDNDGDYYFDFLSTPSKSDDLWDSVLDAVAVSPDLKHYPMGWDDYVSGLRAPHSVVGLSNEDWTGAYFVRLQNYQNDAYDEMLQMDVLPKTSDDRIPSGSHVGLVSQHTFVVKGYTSAPPKVGFFVSYMANRNISDWEGFIGLSIDGTLYIH